MKPHTINTKPGWGERIAATFKQMKTGQFKTQMRELLTREKDPETVTKMFLFLLGGFFSCITFAGLMLGYIRGYKRFMWPKYDLPRLYDLPVIVKVSMALGVVIVWSAIFGLLAGLVVIGVVAPTFLYFIVGFLVANMALCIPVYIGFRRWRNSVWNLIQEMDKNGTARYATAEDMQDYTNKKGLYIGGNYYFDKAGHIFLGMGSRGGKGQNILMANVLSLASQKGSAVYVDPRGEAAAVCANYLRKAGKRVIILNAYDILPHLLGRSNAYNPLALLADKKSDHIIGDVSLIAEMIIPIKKDDHNSFFTDSARNLVAGLLLHLVTSDNVADKTLGTLWKWLRLSGEAWDNLLADMHESTDPVSGEAVRMAASEIVKQQESPETFSSIISNALSATAFLNSPALQRNLASGFDPYTLNDGNTVVFIVAPFETLKTIPNYLRLVVTTLLRAVVRKPSKYKTTFFCDEAFTIGYNSEFLTALSGYAAYNISMFLVHQDLQQLMAIYGENQWQSVMANCTIRIFGSIKDLLTAEHVSKLMGDKTRVMYSQDWLGNITHKESNARPLATPNEVTIMSKDEMILFTGENPVIVVPKVPYYEMPEFRDVNGERLYDLNPYIENSK